MDNNQQNNEQEDLDPLENYYGNKANEDYEKIIDMIEHGSEELTRNDFLVALGIPEAVLDTFFDIAVHKCDGDARNQICDRLIRINKDKLGEIAKRLKYDNIRLKTEKEATQQKIIELWQLVKEKDQQIEDLHANAGHGGGDMSEETSDRISALENERDALQEEINQLKESYQPLKDENFLLRQEVDDLKAEKWDAQTSIEELNRSLQEKDEQIAELHANAGHGGGDMSEETSDRISALENERDALVEQIQSMIESANQQNTNTSDDAIQELNKTIYDLEEELAQKQNIIGDLQESIEEMKENAMHTKQVVDTTAKNNNLWPTNEEFISKEKGENMKEELEFGASINDEPIKKKNSKMGLYIILGIFFVILLALIGTVIINGSNKGPVAGVPTKLDKSELTTGTGLSPSVANGNVVQMTPSPAVNQIQGSEVQGNVPTPLVVAPTPTAQTNSIVATLVTPEDFRRHAANFKITEQGLLIDNQLYKAGEQINGFKILVIQRTFIRFLEPKNDLQFRVDVGV